MLEADVFKITLLELSRAFQAEELPVKMVLLLLDGIWFTCPEKRVTVTRVSEVIQKIMENSVRLSVPLKAKLSSISVYSRWPHRGQQKPSGHCVRNSHFQQSSSEPNCF
jgi:DNA polymerase I-like protein with 3'-5' exonuclease and polymerase domains